MRHYLIVSNDEPTISSIVSQLETDVSVVTICRAGHDALAAITGSPDVAIVDMQIGSMGGIAVTMEIKNRESVGDVKETPVVLLLDRSEDEFLAKRFHANASLVKPIESRRLGQAIKEATAMADPSQAMRHGRHRSMPSSDWLAIARLLVGVGLTATGIATYPTGHFRSIDTVIQRALFVTGAVTVTTVTLERLYRPISRRGAPLDAPASSSLVEPYRNTLTALTAALATIIGLVAVFSQTPPNGVRVGSLALAGSIFWCFTTMLFAIFEPSRTGTLNFLAFMLSGVFLLTTFGLSAIALSVYYK